MKQYYFSIDGQSPQGPTTLDQIRADMHDGLLPANLLIAEESRTVWQTLDEWDRTPPDIKNTALGVPGTSTKAVPAGAIDMLQHVSAGITSAAGMPRIEGFRLREFFAEIFAHRNDDEIERRLGVGSAETTPDLGAVTSEWPRPWIFARVLMLVLIMYFIFLQAWQHFHNTNLIPAILITGSFAAPLSIVVLFFEINRWHNVSLYQTLKWFATGGVVSLIVSLILFDVLASRRLEWMGASIAGPVEELAKVIAAALVVRQARHGRILNGLLAGASVGAGFAAFESAGYALRSFGMGLLRGFLSMESAVNAMTELITVRGVLAPLCHVPWTAATTAALWIARAGAPFEWNMLVRGSFLRVLGVMTVLHMAWNAEFGSEWPLFSKNLILGIVAWIVVFSLVQSGLREIRQTQDAGLSESDAA
jgi:RsiW-degrading membrane proteinase PrsW (M82 family)